MRTKMFLCEYCTFEEKCVYSFLLTHMRLSNDLHRVTVKVRSNFNIATM